MTPMLFLSTLVVLVADFRHPLQMPAGGAAILRIDLPDGVALPDEQRAPVVLLDVFAREEPRGQHDDQHDHSEMAYAAASYALSAADYYLGGSKTRWFSIPKVWPWPDGAWKPKNARRDLVRAAALIIAEIERLDRSHKR